MTESRFDRLLEILRWAYAQDIDGTAKSVLACLAFHAGDKDMETWPAFKTLARECGVKRRAVIYAIKTLEKKGLIHCQRRNHQSTLYKCLVHIMHPPGAFNAPPVVHQMHPNLSQLNLTIEREAKPKNGNGTGNGNQRNGTAGGTRHFCNICEPPHVWVSNDEFDDRSFDLACPDWRKKLKGVPMNAKNQ